MNYRHLGIRFFLVTMLCNGALYAMQMSKELREQSLEFALRRSIERLGAHGKLNLRSPYKDLIVCLEGRNDLALLAYLLDEELFKVEAQGASYDMLKQRLFLKFVIDVIARNGDRYSHEQLQQRIEQRLKILEGNEMAPEAIEIFRKIDAALAGPVYQENSATTGLAMDDTLLDFMLEDQVRIEEYDYSKVQPLEAQVYENAHKKKSLKGLLVAMIRDKIQLIFASNPRETNLQARIVARGKYVQSIFAVTKKPLKKRDLFGTDSGISSSLYQSPHEKALLDLLNELSGYELERAFYLLTHFTIDPLLAQALLVKLSLFSIPSDQEQAQEARHMMIKRLLLQGFAAQVPSQQGQKGIDKVQLTNVLNAIGKGLDNASTQTDLRVAGVQQMQDVQNKRKDKIKKVIEFLRNGSSVIEDRRLSVSGESNQPVASPPKKPKSGEESADRVIAVVDNQQYSQRLIDMQDVSQLSEEVARVPNDRLVGLLKFNVSQMRQQNLRLTEGEVVLKGLAPLATQEREKLNKIVERKKVLEEVTAKLTAAMRTLQEQAEQKINAQEQVRQERIVQLEKQLAEMQAAREKAEQENEQLSDQVEMVSRPMGQKKRCLKN